MASKSMELLHGDDRIRTESVCLAGVDGCKGGWMVALYREGASPMLRRFEALSRLWEDYAPEITGIDMPIGFQDAYEPGGRPCDRAARKALSPKGSCVFSAPVRAAVYAESYAAASRINRGSSSAELGISKQADNLRPKMREVDGLLLARRELVPRVHEVHPELAFAAMAGRVLTEPKRTAAGREIRLGLLDRAFGIKARDLVAGRPRPSDADDVMDALAALWTTRRIAAGTAKVFSGTP